MQTASRLILFPCGSIKIDRGWRLEVLPEAAQKSCMLHGFREISVEEDAVLDLPLSCRAVDAWLSHCTEPAAQGSVDSTDVLAGAAEVRPIFLSLQAALVGVASARGVCLL